MNRRGSREVVYTLVATIALVFGFGTTVRSATFSAFAGAELKIVTIVEITEAGDVVTHDTVPTGLSILGGADFSAVSDSSEDLGNATADTSAAADFGPAPGTLLNVGDPLSALVVKQSVQATGTALQPPDAFAEAMIVADGGISFTNTNPVASDSSFVIALRFISNFNVNATEANPLNDAASATVSYLVMTEGGTVELDISTTSDTESNGGLLVGPVSNVTVALALDPGETNGVQVIASASGMATSLVPEPTSAAALGVVGIALLGRRRRRAA